MTYSFPKPAAWAFLFTAFIYLISVTFITYPLTTFLKPIPILCLIIGVLQSNLLKWAKGILVIALGFSMLGDIVLTLPIKLTLELGIGCFLLAHCFYISLFLKSFEYNRFHLICFLPVLVLMITAACLLLPHLDALLIPVMVYFCILLLMAFSAFQVKRETLIIGSGALLFLISDLTLAFNLFLYPDVDVRIFVMFTYYAAQFFLTWGLVRL